MKNSSILVLLLTLFSPFLTGEIQEPYVIGIPNKKGGLFYSFLNALNKIAWCEKNNRFPVVYWGPASLYYTQGGYNGSENVWEYYFNPISKDTFSKQQVESQGKKDLPFIGWRAEYTRKKWYRHEVYKLISKYIELKAPVQDRITAFYTKNMHGKNTIGIHIRGTDKFTEIAPIDPTIIFDHANKLAESIPNCQFLVATDELSILDEAKKKLRCEVIYYEASRSRDGKPIHFSTNQYNKAKLGEEVLIEVMLLSKTSIFLHTMSNVSSAVLYMNPELEHVLFRDNAPQYSK